MSKFNKKFVSLASSLLALTSIAGSAKAMDDGVYPNYNLEHHTFWNAVKTTQKDYDDYRNHLTDDEKNFLRDNAYYVANRVSNHPKTVAGVAVGSGLALAYKLGAFDSLLGGNKNKKDYRDDFDTDDDDEEETTDTGIQND